MPHIAVSLSPQCLHRVAIERARGPASLVTPPLGEITASPCCLAVTPLSTSSDKAASAHAEEKREGPDKWAHQHMSSTSPKPHPSKSLNGIPKILGFEVGWPKSNGNGSRMVKSRLLPNWKKQFSRHFNTCISYFFSQLRCWPRLVMLPSPWGSCS